MSPVDQSRNRSRRSIKLVSRIAKCIFQQFGFATSGVSQPPSGVSAARNTGIRLARFDWLLFLDAEPTHLEKITRALSAERDLDAVYCGWARVAPDGTVVGRTQETKTGDLFAVLARGCIFSIHSCVIRRVLVEAAGGFDTSLRTCEDWDLWQRIARTGARFGAIPDVLAHYRMRPHSLSGDGIQFFADALRVLVQGHSPDPRVPNFHPAHADGLPPERLASLKFHCASWPAGLVLGRGADARHLLDALADDCDPGLDPSWVAESIFESARLPTCQLPAAWDKLWPNVERVTNEFLLALETRSRAFGLAHRTSTILQRLIVERSTAPRPLTIGATHSVRIEITEPIPDISGPAPIERLHCIIEMEGVRLGTVELPICEGSISSYVLADAIAAELAWPILGQFFEHTIYRDLTIKQESAGAAVYRGSLRLAAGLLQDEQTLRLQAHDRIGWTVFLQEVWARPDWPNERFYDPQFPDEASARRCSADGWLAVDVSEDPPDVEVPGEELKAVLMVGGVALGVVTIPPTQKVVRAQELRAALTSGGGFELCRAVVREGLLGRPFTGPTGSASLRARLAAARGDGSPKFEAPADLVLTMDEAKLGIMTVSGLAPGAPRAINRALSPGKHGVVLGRRAPARIGTSASRRAELPAAATHELVEAATVAGEAVMQVPMPSRKPETVVYVPELISTHLRRTSKPTFKVGNLMVSEPTGMTISYRGEFESLFARGVDPWRYTSPYEQTKYEQTLSLLPPKRISRALELACAEGHFTIQLAPRVESLIAADISQLH